MTDTNNLQQTWINTRDRLAVKGLLSGKNAGLSVRCPDTPKIWLGSATDTQPQLVDLNNPTSAIAKDHSAIYTRRGDIGAIAFGGGAFGSLLPHFGGTLPQLFDEQARHIGRMAGAILLDAQLDKALRGGGNALLWRQIPMCFGMTCTRLALNAELFEKCAKAYVLAAATGGRITRLPWWVRRIANGRLDKDEQRAQEAFTRGELPVETKGY
ncbi:hypothetical protein [Amphritea pacifica]|uniref:Lysozyme n=1 Tax=Amphritea pacifica TaxID=2811233 RepID=A0ABS2W7N1_9GAMM|nr:hypothetical protein [Amphritea pacifica]MBN0987641.1 hypothetical protein [Amphritea pacifica]MBN1009055.1 hypothetical protein [Amphritea pacifica]